MLASINPANQIILDEVQISSAIEIAIKVKAAHAAKKNWKQYGIKYRIEILRKLFDGLKKRENELAITTTREMGKIISESRSDIITDFEYFQDFLDNGPGYVQDEITCQYGKTTHRIVYEPKGVVGCIVPWNFPFTNFVWAVIPNLLVGNVVIFKHSEECPLVGKIIDDIMAAIPELSNGVFSQVYGAGDVGNQLAQQPIDMIWFTGSSHVGKELFQIAGAKMIKSVLEMGGSNPAIVFDDVDIDNIVPKIVHGRFTNCGQVCDATKRLIVHKNIYDNLIEKLIDEVAKLKVGDPEDEFVQIGPLAAMRQLVLLESQVEKSIRLGAKAILGGKRPQALRGAYYEPTLLVNVQCDMPVWREEVFGPVLPIVHFESEEEAIFLANDTVYGLGASVFSTDEERAKRVASELVVGFVDVNEGNHWRPCNPFGGRKFSGMGSEHGRLGFQELCHFKVIAEG